MSKPGVEGRGLLQPEEFDIDDLDYLDPQNGHTSTTEWSRSPKNRRARWLRPRYVCFGLVAVVALLIAGVALNRGGGFKIPKIYGKPQEPSSTLPPEPPGRPSEPEEPASPVKVEEPESQQEPGESETLEGTETDKRPEESKADKTPGESKRPGTVSDTSDLEDAHLGLKETNGTWEKPTGFKIIGLLFFGRPATVAILDCYLQRNLVKNGGWLDEVHFVVNTKNKDDIKWIDGLVKKIPEYTRFDVPESQKGRDGYNVAWATCKKEHMYIKIDDDLVFFDDEAIPNLVYSKIKHPNSLNVVSNLINSPATGFFHYRFGAIHSYLPEVHRSESGVEDGKSYGPTAWRASALPEWKGKEMTWPIAGVAAGKGDDGSHLPEDYPGGPPYKGHRWLPLPDDKKNLWRTPMAESSYDPNGPDWGSWSLGAQAHYSFLQNLENDDLQAYYYGNGKDPRREGIWDMAYHRMNINFMAIWGKDVLDNLPFPSFDDELALSVQIPEKLRRPCLVNTHAIASHFGFRSQVEMYDTDLLSRYRAYANEMISLRAHGARWSTFVPVQRRTFLLAAKSVRRSVIAAPEIRSPLRPMQIRGLKQIDFAGTKETVYEREDWPRQKLLEYFKNDTLALIGYGSQGHGQGLNLRDNGMNVIIGVRKNGASWKEAQQDGWVPGTNLFEVDEAISKGTVVMNLLSDAAQSETWPAIKPQLTKDKTLYFSHGFSPVFKDLTKVDVPKDIDVILVAPKGSGRTVRSLFREGRGINSSFAVYQDVSGKAEEKAIAMGVAIGSGYLYKTTFEKEVYSDLYGERGCLMGGIHGMFLAQYEVLRERGHSPSEAFNETVEEATQSLYPLIGGNGMDWMYAACSTTARRGAIDWSGRFKDTLKPVFNDLYDSVKNGTETQRSLDFNSQPDYREKYEEEMKNIRELEIWRAGKAVRTLRPENQI